MAEDEQSDHVLRVMKHWGWESGWKGSGLAELADFLLKLGDAETNTENQKSEPSREESSVKSD